MGQSQQDSCSGHARSSRWLQKVIQRGFPRGRRGSSKREREAFKEGIFGGWERCRLVKMGDNDFQEFLHCVQDPPQHFQAPAYSYTLVHSITPFEENKSFLEKVELGEKLCGIKEDDSFILDRGWEELRGDDNDRLGWQDSPSWDLFRSPREKDRDDDSDTDNKTIKNQSEESRHSDEEEDDEEDDEDQDVCSPFPSLLPRAESDLAEVITAADRERILETGRTMMETSMTSLPSPEECRRNTRRRRRLPEIPKDKRPLEGLRQQQQQSSLFEELSASTPSWALDQRVAFPPSSPGNNGGPSSGHQDDLGHTGSYLHGQSGSSSISSRTKDVLTSIVDKFDHPGLPPALILNLVNLESLDEGGDVDSGNSTSHSPEDSFRNFYKKDKTEQDTLSPISPSLGGGQRMELLDPTHRGLHRFLPRHTDEIEIEIGDPVYVQKEADDLWCEGINLRTGKQGIFPLAHVVDVDYNDFDPSGSEERKERYILDFVGSVQCRHHKGTEIITQAVNKMGGRVEAGQRTTCILEIGDQGIKMVDKSKPGDKSGVPCHEYFFGLKNVTFCGFHPRDHRYFAFITKHPSPCVQRYACHVFISNSSTRCVAEAYGRAFHRFYKKFLETAFPIEDMYLE